MITGTRKSEGGSGQTTQPKLSKRDEWPELDDEKSVKDMMKDMWGMMQQMNNNASQAKMVAQMASESAETAHKGIGKMKHSIKNIEDDMKEIKDVLMKSPPVPKPSIATAEDMRDLQIIVGGLKEEQDEDKIILQIQQIMNSMSMTHKITRIFTFSDPHKLGVVQFKTIAGKIGFLKKMMTMEAQWDNGDAMWCKKNDTIEKQTSDKEFGFIKHVLTQNGVDQKDVKIKWRKNTVELRGKMVAEMKDDGTIEYYEEALQAKSSILERLKEWKQKRGFAE